MVQVKSSVANEKEEELVSARNYSWREAINIAS